MSRPAAWTQLGRSRIWEEVREINREQGVTIFLTTQYLEEADALAHRVGIIDRGTLVAQGTPEDLKRARGSDLIIAKLDGNVDAAVEAVKSIPAIAGIEVHGQELTLSVGNGAGPHQFRGAGVEPVWRRNPGADIADSDAG